MGRFELTCQTFPWKKYWVQALIAILGNSRTEPRWWSKQHIISSLESLCRLETTDETKVNMPHRSPFITTQTLCCLFVKLYPFYNNYIYSRLVAVMICFGLVTAHELCMRNQATMPSTPYLAFLIDSVHARACGRSMFRVQFWRASSSSSPAAKPRGNDRCSIFKHWRQILCFGSKLAQQISSHV